MNPIDAVFTVVLLFALAAAVYTLLDTLSEGYRVMIERKETEIKHALWEGRISLPESCVLLHQLYAKQPWYVRLNNRLRTIFN